MKLQDNGHQKLNPCLLAAVVCDIRGFTELTGRVNSFASSLLHGKEKVDRLLQRYTRYVEMSQKETKRILLRDLDDQKYAVKGTGDGLLIALELESDWEKAIEPDLDDFQERVASLTTNLVRLVKASEITPEAAVGKYTDNFLDDWGVHLGLDQELLDHFELRIAAAMTLGVGFLWPGEDERTGGTEGNVEEQDTSASYGDAVGHTVNLTFRLCSQAGRRIDGGRLTPPILVDRRTGAVLLQSERKYFEDWELKCYHFWSHMKGIEESWCYAVLHPDDVSDDGIDGIALSPYARPLVHG